MLTQRLEKLVDLRLDDNPISSQTKYRAFVLKELKYINTLDGRKVSDEERLV